MKKILFLTNNKITEPLYKWLCDLNNYKVILYSDPINLTEFNEIGPDLIISYNYRHIIKDEVIKVYSKIINLHISLLPWNRGANPNFWSFIEDTPKGVTIHFIDKGIDTGDIIFQKELFFDEGKETLTSSYEKLNIEIQKLFIENWGNLKNFNINPEKQSNCATFHKQREFDKIKSVIGENIYNIPIFKLKQIYREILNDKNKQ